MQQEMLYGNKRQKDTVEGCKREIAITHYKNK